MKLCTKCNKYEPTSRNECRVCGFKHRHKEEIETILSENEWSEDELDVFLYNVLYGKISVINDIIPLLNNKTFDDLIDLLTNKLTLKSVRFDLRISCDVCGKEYFVKLSEYLHNLGKHNYCCIDCRNKGFTLFKSHAGVNNSQYNSETVYCANCGKAILKPKWERERTNRFGDVHNFCCQECYWEYRKKYYVGEKSVNYGKKFDEERLKQMSAITTQRISKGDFGQTNTKPHLIVDNMLKEMGIEFENEKNCKYYSVDIFIPKDDLFVEIMGDYWHGSPIKYKDYNKLSKIQKDDVNRDKRKHTYIKKYYKREILYLWEKDINFYPDKCRALLQRFIKNHGNLRNYHSFNYSFKNGTLRLNRKIIQPYFITENP